MEYRLVNVACKYKDDKECYIIPHYCTLLTPIPLSYSQRTFNKQQNSTIIDYLRQFGNHHNVVCGALPGYDT